MRDVLRSECTPRSSKKTNRSRAFLIGGTLDQSVGHEDPGIAFGEEAEVAPQDHRGDRFLLSHGGLLSKLGRVGLRHGTPVFVRVDYGWQHTVHVVALVPELRRHQTWSIALTTRRMSIAS